MKHNSYNTNDYIEINVNDYILSGMLHPSNFFDFHIAYA